MCSFFLHYTPRYPPPPPPEHKHKSTQSYHACYPAHEVLHVSLVFTKQLLVTDEILAKLAQKPSQKMRFFKFLGRWAKRKRRSKFNFIWEIWWLVDGIFLPYPGGGEYIRYRYTHIIEDAEAKRSSLIIKSLFLLYLWC